MPLSEIKELQGQLKELSVEGYEKLKKSIIEHGFSFPIEVAVINGRPYGILDGHQRLRTVREMVRREGYILPDGRLPVCFTQCRDREQAGRLILHAISQYARVQEEGLYSFANDFKIDPKSLVSDFDIPDFDTERFLGGYFEDRTDTLEEPASPAIEDYAGANLPPDLEQGAVLHIRVAPEMAGLDERGRSDTHTGVQGERRRGRRRVHSRRDSGLD